MKKIFAFFLAVLLIGTAVQAQIRVDVKKTITAADTSTISNVGDKVVALQYTYVETSGTTAGKVYIEGTVDGVGWKHVDSTLSLSDVTTAQTVHIAVTATTFRNYRARNTNTGSATGTIYFTALRRPDDR